MIKVAFILEGHEWLGGINYYRNLFSAINLLKNRRIQPILFLGKKVPNSIVKHFYGTQIIRLSLLDSDSASGILRRIIRKFFGGNDLAIYVMLKCFQINVLSHFAGKIPMDLKLKKIGWIPDFQYLHLPAFFSAQDLKMRAAAVKELIPNSNWIVLSSKEAMKDLGALHPEALEHSSVLRFVPEINNLENFSIKALDDFRHRYKITGPYFYVPNQFWVHKNHEILIRALEHVKKRGIEAKILLTGSNIDHRFPGHYKFLIDLARGLGVISNFIHLGIVPYRDLEILMNNSIAVINPSLFEGWSTTVEEAKAMDKKILLSDIPVHREQNPEKGIFFDPSSFLDLADKMISVLEDNGVTGMQFNTSHLRRHARRRMAFGLRYQKIILGLQG